MSDGEIDPVEAAPPPLRAPEAEGRLDAELRYFLRHAVRTGLGLRVLLLMRDAPYVEWRARSVGAALATRALDAGRAMAALEREGLIVCTDHGYLYAPRSPRLDGLAERLSRISARGLLQPLDRLLTA